MAVIDANGDTIPTHRLTPEHGRKGAAAANAIKNSKAVALRAKADVVWAVVDEAADLAPETLAGALQLAEQLREQTATLDVGDWLDAKRAADVLEVLHRVSRLASGQSTSNVAHAGAMSEEERTERLARLGQVARQHIEDEAPPSPAE